MQSLAYEYNPDLRWNYLMGVLNGAAFKLVDTLVNPYLVQVVFLSQLTDNPIILGMPAALWMGGFYLSQLWVSGRVQRLEYALPVYRGTSLVRAVMWVILILATILAREPTVLIAVFLLFLVVYPLTWGVAGLAFMELVAKVIPPRLRGQFFSWRMTLGGILAIGGGWYVNQVLAPGFALGFPQNFAFLFASAAVITILGVLPFHLLREPRGEAHPPALPGIRGRWREIRLLWQQDPLYRHYIKARVALLVAAGTAPLIIVYARGRFGLPLRSAALFLVADTVTGLLAVAASGWLSLRLGNRVLALGAAALGMGVFLLILAAAPLNLSQELALPYFLVVFVLLAAYNGAVAISMFALNLNIAPPERRPLYVGLGNTLVGLASYLSTGQGVVVSLVGYPGLFLLAGLLVAFAAWHIFQLCDPTEAEPAEA